MTDQIIWCAMCIQLNMIDQREKQPAVTVSHGVAMCMRHFAHTRTGMNTEDPTQNPRSRTGEDDMRPKVDQRAYNEVCDLWEISEYERADPRVRAAVVTTIAYQRRAFGLAILGLRDDLRGRFMDGLTAMRRSRHDR